MGAQGGPEGFLMTVTLGLSGQGRHGHARAGDCLCGGIKVRSSGAGARCAGRQGPSRRPGTARAELGLQPTGGSGEQGKATRKSVF